LPRCSLSISLAWPPSDIFDYGYGDVANFLDKHTSQTADWFITNFCNLLPVAEFDAIAEDAASRIADIVEGL
jgi:hypothetical protein